VSGGDKLADKFKKMEKVTKSVTYMETVFDALLEKDSVDLETDFTAYSAILGLDKNFVGTSHYMGLFPFWNQAYKYDLRDASPKARQAVHRTLLLNGKKVSSKSPAIKKIIETVLGTF
jgi:hypothetical protein